MVNLKLDRGTAYCSFNEIIDRLPSSELNQAIYVENVRRSKHRSDRSTYPYDHGMKSEVPQGLIHGAQASSMKQEKAFGMPFAISDIKSNTYAVYIPPKEIKLKQDRLDMMLKTVNLLETGAKLAGDANLNLLLADKNKSPNPIIKSCAEYIHSRN